MTLKLGDSVWIPCDVTPGVFPDERNVSIAVAAGVWSGWVDVGQLREAVSDGPTAIRATIVGGAHGKLFARLPGQTTQRQYVALTET